MIAATLLNALANRLGDLEIHHGNIFYTRTDGTATAPLSTADLSQTVGYVPQQDLLLPYLTPRETLEFAASLRLPVSIDRTARRELVERTLRELGLSEVADNLIGGGTGKKGISGGERRRVSIGLLLVTQPSVLLLDEVTTGLDSSTAHHLLETLSKLAKGDERLPLHQRTRRTIIISIHQGRSDCVEFVSDCHLADR